VVADSVLLDAQAGARREAGEGGPAEMRVGRQVVARGDITVGEIAASAARDPDLFADADGMIDDEHRAPARAAGRGAHQPGRPGPDNDHIMSQRQLRSRSG
jgi:hypothetical protein